MYVTHPVHPGFRILDTLPEPDIGPDALHVAEQVWRARLAANPGMFNGRLFSMDRLEDGVALGFMAQYKWYVAQLDRPDLADAYRIRSLAVSGLLVVNGHILFGLRKPTLSVEPGLWEMVPSGTINASHREEDGSLSWRGVFREEAAEELGISLPDIPLTPFALVEDTQTRIWELGVSATLSMDHRDVLAAWAMADTAEHTEMAAVPLDDVPRFVKEKAAVSTGVTPHLYEAWSDRQNRR